MSIIASILPSVISGGTNLFGSVAGLVSSNQANKTALRMNRENNDANKQLVELQNQFNIDQWNRNNDYNSLASQKERALAAGFNPNILSGSNSVSSSPVVQTGYAQQTSGADLVQNQASLNMAGMMNLGYSGSSALDGVLKASQAKLLDKQAESQEIENSFKPGYIDTQIRNLNALTDQYRSNIDANIQAIEESKKRADFTDSQRAGQDITNINLQDLYSYQIEGIKSSNAKMLEEMKWIGYNSKTARINANANERSSKAQAVIAQSSKIMAQANADYLEKLGIKVSEEAKLVYQQCITEVANGDLKQAQADWQKFENAIRGGIGYARYQFWEIERQNTINVNLHKQSLNLDAQSFNYIMSGIKPF